MNYKRIMVFGAHPDDEQAMAATMAKMAALGVEVTVAIMTDGREGYPRPEMKDTIVAMRRQEQVECDQVLGVARRINFDRPDLALVNDKQTVLEVVAAIRQVRPEAIFTHGPEEWHRDHANTNAITIEAAWHAGEPVVAALGEPWHTPHVWYYKGCGSRRADVTYDVTGYAHYRQLSRATQVSQHTLFGKNKEQWLAEAEEVRQANPRSEDQFWVTGRTALRDLPDLV